MKDRLPLVADLLMDAAYADNHLAGEEKTAVRKLLRDLLGGQDALPMDVDFRINEFSPAGFDLAGTGRAFAGDPPAQKRRLLELCAAVHAADGEIDMAEDAHLRRVAGAIGLPEDQYQDMVVDILEDVAVDAHEFEAIRFGAGVDDDPGTPT
jgi:uncharacterized tellurite resistance protein B-like protein